jgi:hypothetical protein
MCKNLISLKNISILTKIVKYSPDLCLGIGKRTIFYYVAMYFAYNNREVV